MKVKLISFKGGGGTPYTDLVVQGENNERKTFNNTSELKAWVNQYGVTPVNFKCDNKFTILGSGGSSSNSDDRAMRDLSRAMSQILDKLKVIERGQCSIKSKVDNIQLPQLPQQNDIPATQQDITALLQILADLDTKMDTVLQEQQSSKVEMTHGFDAVKQKLAEVGVHTDEELKAFQDEMKTKFKYLFTDKTLEGNIKYPRCKNDMNKDVVYYSEDVSRSQEAFDRLVGDNQYVVDYDLSTERPVTGSDGQIIKKATIFKVDYDENAFNILRKHIEICNKVRANTEDVFDSDLHAKHNDGVNADLSREYNTIGTVYGFIGATMLSSLVFPANTIGAAVVALGLPKIINGTKTIGEMGNIIANNTVLGSSDKHMISKFRTDAGTVTQQRNSGVYNQFTLTDVKTDELLASTNDTDAYSIDIRLFVVNCKGCLIKRGMNDIRKRGTSFFSNKQAIKNKPYKVYVDKSLAVLPIEHDERLFNFYVNFYLKPYARIDAKETKNYHAYNYSQTGLDSNKSYFDLFVNAYFAAKKSLLHVGVNFLKIIDDMEYNLVTQEDILLYAQFLLRIKMCLIIQGMRAEKAEWMLHKFMHYDGTLSIYQGKMVQMRSTVQNGYEVK